MALMFKRSEDGVIVCADCLAPGEEMVSAELQPRLFPGTYGKLHCTRCGAAGDSAAEATPLPVLASSAG